MTTIGSRLGLGVLVIFSFVVTGCANKGDGLYEVSGKVTLEGQLLDDGEIMFEPMDSQGTRAGSPIRNGEFKVERKSGLKPGKYVVQITSGDGKTPDNPEEAAAPGAGTNILSADRIPPEWNVDSKQQIEIKAGEKNQFTFDIPKAADPRAKKKQ